MRGDFSTGIRLSSVIVVPAALLLAVLGGAAGRVPVPPRARQHVGGRGAVHRRGVRARSRSFLVPYMMFQLLLRVFYALHDSRTPMFIGVVTMIVNSTASLLALYLLPPATWWKGWASRSAWAT